MSININKHNRKPVIKALAKKMALGAAATGMLLGMGASITQINANADDWTSSILNDPNIIKSNEKTNAMGAKSDEEIGENTGTPVDPTKDLENAEKRDKEQEQQQKAKEEKNDAEIEKENRESEEQTKKGQEKLDQDNFHQTKAEEIRDKITGMKDAGIYNMLHHKWQKEGLSDAQGLGLAPVHHHHNHIRSHAKRIARYHHHYFHRSHAARHHSYRHATRRSKKAKQNFKKFLNKKNYYVKKYSKLSKRAQKKLLNRADRSLSRIINENYKNLSKKQIKNLNSENRRDVNKIMALRKLLGFHDHPYLEY